MRIAIESLRYIFNLIFRKITLKLYGKLKVPFYASITSFKIVRFVRFLLWKSIFHTEFCCYAIKFCVKTEISYLYSTYFFFFYLFYFFFSVSLSLSYYSKFVKEKNIFSFVRVLFAPFYSLGFSCFIFLEFALILKMALSVVRNDSKHSILKINLFLSQSCMVLRYYFPVVFFGFTQSYPKYSIKLNFIFQI